jgi:hypothetical protein
MKREADVARVRILIALIAWVGVASTARGELDFRKSVTLPQAPLTMTVFELKPSQQIPAAIATAFSVDEKEVREGTNGDVAYFRPLRATGPIAGPTFSPSVIAADFFSALLQNPPDFDAVPSAGFRVMRHRVRKNETPGAPEEVSTLVRVDRYVKRMRVFGEGSQAVAEVGGSNVTGVVVRWDLASPVGERPTIRLTRARIEDAFERQYGRSADGVVVPDSPELVYLGDRQFLEPMYRVLIQISQSKPAGGFEAVPDDLAVLYIPATTPRPRQPIPSDRSAPVECTDAIGAAPTGIIPLDLYTLTGSLFDWAGSARAFRTAILANNLYAGRRFCLLEPRMLENSDKNIFLNSVPIALVETHGLPGWLYTSQEDGVLLEAAGGYGTDGGGSLRLLVLHSCEVVSSYEDNTAWSNRWFKVFAGLHTVLGYRTPALADGVPAKFATHAATGEPLIRSWLAEVALYPGYSAGNTVMATGGSKPLGRASAVTVCDEDDRNLETLADLRDPQCLVNYWLANTPKAR